MTEQLRLKWSPNYRLNEEYEAFLSEAAAVVRHVTQKEFCFATNAKPSDLSHALAGRDGHHFRAKWALYAQRVSPNLRLAASFVGPGFEVRQVVTDTPEQRIAKLENFIRRNAIVERAAKEEGVL